MVVVNHMNEVETQKIQQHTWYEYEANLFNKIKQQTSWNSNTKEFFFQVFSVSPPLWKLEKSRKYTCREWGKNENKSSFFLYILSRSVKHMIIINKDSTQNKKAAEPSIFMLIQRDMNGKMGSFLPLHHGNLVQLTFRWSPLSLHGFVASLAYQVYEPSLWNIFSQRVKNRLDNKNQTFERWWFREETPFCDRVLVRFSRRFLFFYNSKNISITFHSIQWILPTESNCEDVKQNPRGVKNTSGSFIQNIRGRFSATRCLKAIKRINKAKNMQKVINNF